MGLPSLDEGARSPWRWPEWSALAGGWAVALATLLPGALPPDAGPHAAAALTLVASLAFWVAVVAVMRSDLLHYIIPDEASVAIAALALASAAGTPWLSGDGATGAGRAVLDAAATGAGAFVTFWAIGAAFRAAGRDALGFGDVKLAGACALWLSPADAALALEFAALGALAMLLLARRGGPLRDAAMPFGAFMAPSAWLVFVLAPPLRDAGLLPW